MRFAGKTTYTVSVVIFVLLLAGIGTAMGAETPGPRIVVLVSQQAVPFEGALSGFKEYLSSRGVQAQIDVTLMDGDEKQAANALSSTGKDKVGLIFTLGSRATEAVVKSRPGVPVLAGLILSADDIKEGGHAGCVVLDFPLELQFEWISRILPEARNIGVLYNPGNQRKVDKAIGVAQGKGITLIARRVDTPSDLPDALNSLAKRVDALWGIPDELVYTPQTAKEILLFSFRNRIPVIGLSNAWVKAGALYSLDWDFKDLGMQCGEMAVKILRGAQIVPHAEYPRKVKCSVNLKTAAQMKVVIPEKVVQGSDQVFK